MSSVKGGITPLFARRTKPAKVSLVFAKYTGLGAMVPILKIRKRWWGFDLTKAKKRNDWKSPWKTVVPRELIPCGARQ